MVYNVSAAPYGVSEPSSAKFHLTIVSILLPGFVALPLANCLGCRNQSWDNSSDITEYDPCKNHLQSV